MIFGSMEALASTNSPESEQASAPAASAATISRFVVWASASLDVCGCEDAEDFRALLRSCHCTSLGEIHGRKPDTFGSRAEGIETFLAGYDLGILARGFLPGASSDGLYDGSDLPVTVLDLGRRASNCLEKARISTVRELLSWSPERLLRLPNMGRKSLHEIQEKLLLFREIGSLKSFCVRPNCFPLGLFVIVEQCGFRDDTLSALLNAGFSNLFEVVTHAHDFLSRSFALTRPQLNELETRLNSLGLYFGMPITDPAESL